MSTTNEQKQRLIEAGAAHRHAIGAARTQLQAGLKWDSLVGKLAATAVTAVRQKPGSTVRMALPWVLKGISSLAKRKRSKQDDQPVKKSRKGKLLIAAALGVAGALILKRQWRRDRRTGK